jgi:hypothetical protein
MTPANVPQIPSKQVSVSLAVIQATVNYLAARPYNEVAGILEALSRELQPQLEALQPANAPKSAEPTNAEETKTA